MKILATYNIKGGVGKTSTAVNLAYLAATSGARTLLWDLDPQGAATFCFRIKPKVKGGAKKLVRGKGRIERRIRGTDFEGLDLLPADFSYRHMDLLLDAVKRGKRRISERVEPLEDRYDYLFLDCAPSISLVSEAVFVAADALLVPTIPTTLSVRTVRRLAKHLAGGKPRVTLLPFFCMVDRRKALHREICDSADERPFDFLETRIPYSSVVERMGVHRAPLHTFARASEAARAYANLWSEITTRLVDGGRHDVKTIFILRHGKSSWDSGHDSDHERPLAKRGRDAAEIVGKLLARTGQVPDRVLSSSAVRARETVELAVEAGAWSCPVKIVPDFYGGSTDTVMARVREEDDDASSLLLAGHEPTWSALVGELSGGGFLRFPTAALARVDTPIDCWRDLEPDRGALVWFLIPRLVKAMGFETR